VDGVGSSGRQVRRRAAALRHSLIGQDKSLLVDVADGDDDDDDDYDDNAPLATLTSAVGRPRRGRPLKSAIQPSKPAVQPSKPVVRLLKPVVQAGGRAAKPVVQLPKSAVQAPKPQPGTRLVIVYYDITQPH